MPTDDASPDNVEVAARALLDERMDSIRAHTRSSQAVTDQLAALDSAHRENARTYADALRRGWTPDEMKKLGFAEPTRRPAGRPARRRATRTPSTTPTAETPNTGD